MRIIITDYVIRIIQLRAWEDYGESLDYEAVRLYLAGGNPAELTKEQKEYASDLKREVKAAEEKVRSGADRYEVYSGAALITSLEEYNRVFEPTGFDECFGGFGIDLNTPEWLAEKANWEEKHASTDDLTQGSRRSPAERVRWEKEEQRSERFFTIYGGNERYGACDDEKQDKHRPHFHGRQRHNCPQCGQFREIEDGVKMIRRTRFWCQIRRNARNSKVYSGVNTGDGRIVWAIR